MVKITKENAENMLRGIKGTTFATLVVEVEPAVKRPKTSGMAGRIKKWSKVNCTLGFIYANSVNRQRERESREADFVPAARRWGVRLEGTPIIYHKNNLYLETKVEKVYDTQYFLDGQPVEYDEIAEFLQSKSGESRQNVEKEVVLRDYKLDSIRKITINNMTYVVE